MAHERWHFNLKWIFVFLALLGVMGCASARKQPPAGNESNVSTPGPESKGKEVSTVPFGPLAPGVIGNQVFGPEQLQTRSVILVLGPGGAKAFANVGVLRALNAAKIPIAAIFGCDVSALVGTLYAMEGNINRFEWGLMRFNEVFAEQEGFFSKMIGKPANTSKYEDELRNVFGDKVLTSSSIPVRVCFESEGKIVIQKNGLISEALRAATDLPEVFNQAHWNGQEAKIAKYYPLKEAKLEATGPLVVVDTLGTLSAQDADVVIEPKLSGIGEMEFEKKSEAAFLGKEATMQALQELRRQVGLPPEDETQESGSEP